MKLKTKEWICVWLAIGFFALSIVLLIVSLLHAFNGDLVKAQCAITRSLLLLVLSAGAKVKRQTFNPFLSDEHKREVASDLRWSVAWFLMSLALSLISHLTLVK